MGMTIQSVIDIILSKIPSGVLEETVDTVKSGDPGKEVTGIVSTCMATQEVISKAIDIGANFIITHEPTYYSHLDETDWLEDDQVYKAKRKLIDDNGICIWRFHDYWHRYVPDGIVTGVKKALGWQDFNKKEERVFNIPQMSLPEMAKFLKEKLNIATVRTIGNPEHVCSNVAFMVGSSGGRNHNVFARRDDVDTLVCGETNEWETAEYFRDAVYQGRNKAFVLIGHINSEEDGMKYLVDWLQPMVPDIQITHVPAGDAFRFV